MTDTDDRSHDPFAPSSANPAVNPGEIETRGDLDAAYAAFPEDRWRRVGATDDDVAGLRAVWDGYDARTQAEEGQTIASLPDPALAAALDAFRSQFGKTITEPPSSHDETGGVDLAKGVKAIIAEVGDDPAKAAAVLAAEKAKGDNVRSSLVDALERVAAKVAAPDPVTPEPASGGAEQAGDASGGDGAGDGTPDANAEAVGEQQKPPATQ